MSDPEHNVRPDKLDYDQALDYINRMLEREDIQQAFSDANVTIPTEETRIPQRRHVDLDPAEDLDVRGKLNNLPMHFNPKPMLFDVYRSRPVVKRLEIMAKDLYDFLVECEGRFQNDEYRTDSTVYRQSESVAVGAANFVAEGKTAVAPLARKEIPGYNDALIQAEHILAHLVDSRDASVDRDVFLTDGSPNPDYLTN